MKPFAPLVSALILGPLAGVVALLATAAPLPAQSPTARPDGSEGLDPIERLRIEVERGDRSLAHDTVWGYLPALLQALDVPVSSQGLVFSRTSLQTDRIAPWAPRALYFNDDVYVGWVQESPFVEIAVVDPDDGARFYTLPQDPDGPPVFHEETTTCLMCHESRLTGGIPGFLMLSTLADRSGYPVTEFHSGSTTDATPIARRWGGWYVTGHAGEDGHAGNIRSDRHVHEIDDRAHHLAEMNPGPSAEVQALDDYFYTDAYLSEHSDVVALLVLAHQTHIHNLMSSARAETEAAMRDQRALVSTQGVEIPESGYLPVTRSRIREAARVLLEGMLFTDEAELRGPVEGTSGFREDFEARGPFDSRGRTLRSFDLETRLFTYPLSFLIYSDAFAALPEDLTDALFTELARVLAAGDEFGSYPHLDAETRAALTAILRDTLPESVPYLTGESRG